MCKTVRILLLGAVLLGAFICLGSVSEHAFAQSLVVHAHQNSLHDEFSRKLYKKGYRDGYSSGYQDGLQSCNNLHAEKDIVGQAETVDESYQAGFDRGYQSGLAKGKQECEQDQIGGEGDGNDNS